MLSKFRTIRSTVALIILCPRTSDDGEVSQEEIEIEDSPFPLSLRGCPS